MNAQQNLRIVAENLYIYGFQNVIIRKCKFLKIQLNP